MHVAFVFLKKNICVGWNQCILIHFKYIQIVCSILERHDADGNI